MTKAAVYASRDILILRHRAELIIVSRRQRTASALCASSYCIALAPDRAQVATLHSIVDPAKAEDRAEP